MSPRLPTGSPLSLFPIHEGTLPSVLPSSGPGSPRDGSRNVTAQIHQLEDAAKQHRHFTLRLGSTRFLGHLADLFSVSVTFHISWTLNNSKSYTPRMAFVCLINYPSLTLCTVKHLLP